MSNIIHFWQLPQTRTYVVLQTDVAQGVFHYIKRCAGTLYNASKLTGVHRPTIRALHLKPFKPIRVDILRKLSDYLVKRGYKEFSMSKLEEKINWIGHPLSNGISNPKLPFRVDTPSSVRVIAAMFNDGHISRNRARNYGEMHYYNENPTLRSRMITSATSAFGGGKESYQVREHRSYHYIIFPSVIRDMMKLIGVPAGSKVNQNPHIPPLVYASKRHDQWRAWLRQTADDEGSIRFRSKTHSRHVCWRRCIALDSGLKVRIRNRERPFSKLGNELKEVINHHRPNLLGEEKDLLKRLGIECRVRPLSVYKIKTGECRAKWELCISGREDLVSFHRMIGFYHPKKKSLLVKALQSYR